MNTKVIKIVGTEVKVSKQMASKLVEAIGFLNFVTL
jgi:hypothetical protein